MPKTAVDRFRSVVAIDLAVPFGVSGQRHKEVTERRHLEIKVIYDLKSKLYTDIWMIEIFHKKLHKRLSPFMDRLNEQLRELDNASYEYVVLHDPIIPLEEFKKKEEKVQEHRRTFCREYYKKDEFHERFEENIKAIKKCLSSSLK